MIKDVIRRLQKASVRPNDFTSRYSELLDRLWQRKDSEIQARLNNTSSSNVTNNHHDVVPVGEGGAFADAPNVTVGSGTGVGPAVAGGGRNWFMGQQDEFSWLDLQAVGELVSGEGETGGLGGMEGYGQWMGGGEWGDFGLVDGDDVSRFF